MSQNCGLFVSRDPTRAWKRLVLHTKAIIVLLLPVESVGYVQIMSVWSQEEIRVKLVGAVGHAVALSTPWIASADPHAQTRMDVLTHEGVAGVALEPRC